MGLFGRKASAEERRGAAGKNPRRAESALSRALRPVRLGGDDLYDATVDFVLTGADPGVLVRLAEAVTAEMQSALGIRSDLSWGNHRKDKRIAARIGGGWSLRQGVAARGECYRDNLLDAAQYSRLGLVFELVGPDVARASKAVPDWFTALVNDVVASGAEVPGNRQQWTPQWLTEVARAGLEDDDAAPVVVLGTLFDWSTGHWTAQGFRALGDNPAVGPYLVAHGDAVEAFAASASKDAKVRLLASIAGHSATANLAGVVARLAADPAKKVRTEAALTLSAAPVDSALAAAEPVLLTAPSGRLTELATVVASVDGGPQLLARLAEAEAPGPRRTLLESLARRGGELDAAESTRLEVPPFEPVPDTKLGPEFVTAARAAIDAWLERDRGRLAELDPEDEQWRHTRSFLEDSVEILSAATDAGLRDVAAYLATGQPLTSKAARAAMKAAQVVSGALVPMLRLPHRVRFAAGTGGFNWWWLRENADLDVDLRVLVDLVGRAGFDDPAKLTVERVITRTWPAPLVSPENLWPYFAEHPEPLEEVLGVRPRAAAFGSDQIELAMEVLRAMPAIPAQFLPRLAALALGDAKRHRLSAQRVLASAALARPLAEQGLTDSKAEMRASAAAWLARIGEPEAVPALEAALGKERREVARAAILSALESLGADISRWLTPDALAAEAAKGLGRKVQASLNWFPFEALPLARWAATGEPVPAPVIRWWVVLADKLKDPSGLGLIDRYLSLLDGDSRRVLGSFVLSAWTRRDTRHPSPDESRAWADGEAQQRYDYAQRMFQRNQKDWAREAAAVSLQEHWDAAFREHQAAYTSSAMANKGLLALTVRMPGAELAEAVQAYIRENKTRRAQIDALVTALGAHSDREPVQVLLSIARRFSMATVQAHARELVEDLAERRGWSADQLADRTVATAGFDDDGILRLDLGARTVTGRISPKFTIELTNPEGKVVKALPTARQGDDPQAYGAAKKQLSASRRELKQVLDLQTARLYEAMCIGRAWPAREWLEYVLGHPVMSRLAERLVWAEQTEAGLRPFRPDGGTLLDVDDEETGLVEGAEVVLAHVSQLDAESAAAWHRHLRDYNVMPLFDQLSAIRPPNPEGATVIADHKGWLSDSFSIRGRATKLGYVRGAAEDAGWFGDYRKPYEGIGLIAVLGFTGAFVPEENIPAAATTLTFERVRGRGTVPLSEVPPVLYAETYRDYVTVAEAGAFDPDWERKSEW